LPLLMSCAPARYSVIPRETGNAPATVELMGCTRPAIHPASATSRGVSAPSRHLCCGFILVPVTPFIGSR